MFDVDKALSAALENADQSDLIKLQEQERMKLRGITATDSKVTFGLRAIALANEAMEKMAPDDPRRDFESERLAEGLFLIGKIDDAVKTSLRKKAEYQAYLDALTQKRCVCSDRVKIRGGYAGPRYIKDTFLHNGRKRTLYACSSCGIEYAT